jgi:hypothetical protein
MEAVMLDAIFLGAGLAFFVAAILYTFACERRTLRQKLEADPEQPSLILTEQGVGYRLRAAD